MNFEWCGHKITMWIHKSLKVKLGQCLSDFQFKLSYTFLSSSYITILLYFVVSSSMLSANNYLFYFFFFSNYVFGEGGVKKFIFAVILYADSFNEILQKTSLLAFVLSNFIYNLYLFVFFIFLISLMFCRKCFSSLPCLKMFIMSGFGR